MKNVLFLLFICLSLLGHNINAQGEGEVPNYLFLFGQIDVSSQTTISYTLTSQGTY